MRRCRTLKSQGRILCNHCGVLAIWARWILCLILLILYIWLILVITRILLWLIVYLSRRILILVLRYCSLVRSVWACILRNKSLVCNLIGYNALWRVLSFHSLSIISRYWLIILLGNIYLNNLRNVILCLKTHKIVLILIN